MCFSCSATTNEFWPHYSVHTGAYNANNHNNNINGQTNFNKYERNNDYGVGIERRDQFKCGRPLSHSLGAPSISSATLATAINFGDSVPNLCAGDNRSIDAFGADRATRMYIDSISSARVIEDNCRSKLLVGKPPISDKSLRTFFGVSLDEREMPITRERQTKQIPVAAKRDLNGGGRKQNKSSNGCSSAMHSTRNGNTKCNLFTDRNR